MCVCVVSGHRSVDKGRSISDDQRGGRGEGEPEREMLMCTNGYGEGEKCTSLLT